ncbi:meiosis 1 arrest protein [Lingula anatina]|uniref:Meiosis 1 arrest protein n=1 Tax=Lingula anatina TaxID=7574 RepID=A0A1S3KF00_LINAN|nr:meiosis 1 arrest protein [Lingula anatina]|eukprot:XP_013421029.1 meiosis 1 arrest protein [Lingula anatina]
MQEKNERGLFTRQPARMLLVDFSSNFDADTGHSLTQALENFFALVCNLGGPNRTPFFGLISLSDYPETLFPLQTVRASFPRLQAALNELKNCHRTSLMCHRRGGCLDQGISEALAQFKRQAQNLFQISGYWNQLEITVITCQTSASIVKQVEKLSSKLDLDNLKKIQVVCVNNPDQVSVLDDIGDVTDSSQRSDVSLGSSSSGGTEGMVEVVNMDNDVLIFQDFFKTWLYDASTDKEHLHLVLPDSLTIKCDLHERLLDPSLLPFNLQFQLQPDSFMSKPVIPTVKKGQNTVVPVHRLLVKNLLPANSICESVVYGYPQVMRPTTCWKIDWDELEMNQQLFQAMCSLLQEKEMVLLACTAEVKSENSYASDSPTSPCGHFLLLPSHSCSVLIKPIAVSELMMPCDFTVPKENPCQDSVDAVQAALKKVKVLEMYNPLLTQSGLYQALIKRLSGGSSGNKNLKRRLGVTTQCPGATRGRGRGRTQPGFYYAPKSQKRFCYNSFIADNDDPFPTQL